VGPHSSAVALGAARHVRQRPFGAVDDVWLRTEYAVDGTGSIDPEITASERAYPLVIEIAELGIEERFMRPSDVAAFPVGLVEPWSAEVPGLYEARVSSPGETLSLRPGFRRTRIDGDVLSVNSRQVIFRGVNRHEVHPVVGRMFDEQHARHDMITMKRAGINAIRTSTIHRIHAYLILPTNSASG
jgi:beta-galactosidase